MIHFFSGLLVGLIIGFAVTIAIQSNPQHDVFRQHEIEKMRERR